MHFEYAIVGGDFTRAGQASSMFKKVLLQLNVDAQIIKRIVIALYEAEVNIVAHAFHGKMIIDLDKDSVTMLLEDKGPGISDIEKAMQIGFSTASQKVREMGFGAGMGLSNIKNNVDSLKITSESGVGTRVEMYVSIPKTPLP